jgi:hypothetical protein
MLVDGERVSSWTSRKGEMNARSHDPGPRVGNGFSELFGTSYSSAPSSSALAFLDA